MEPKRRLLSGALIGAGLGLLLGLWLTMPGAGGDALVGLAMLAAVGALFGVLFVSVVEGGRPFVLREWVPVPAGEIRQHALRWYAVNGWTLQGSAGDTLAFSRGTAAGAGDAGCLLVFGGLFGLLYLLLRRQT